MQLIYGIEPSFGVRYSEQNGARRTILSPSLGYVVGLQYNVHSNIFIGLETVPAFQGRFFIDSNSIQNRGFTLGMGFETAALTLLYQFEK